MIDPKLINGDELVRRILDDLNGNMHPWWRLVEFVPDYMPPFPGPDTRPTRWSVKCGESYLRDLGRGVFIWDTHYGEDSDFYSPEGALLGLMNAPVPPYLLNEQVWPGRQTTL